MRRIIALLDKCLFGSRAARREGGGKNLHADARRRSLICISPAAVLLDAGRTAAISAHQTDDEEEEEDEGKLDGGDKRPSTAAAAAASMIILSIEDRFIGPA